MLLCNPCSINEMEENCKVFLIQIWFVIGCESKVMKGWNILKSIVAISPSFVFYLCDYMFDYPMIVQGFKKILLK
jgi:hypothetical protein